MSDTLQTKGKLYLVPAPLDFGCATQSSITDVLPELTLRTAARLQHWVCENAKSTRAYLKRVGEHFPLAAPIQQQHLQELPREAHKKGDHGGKDGAVFDAKALLAPALAGHDMGLVSEAGMPAVADPGSSIVRAAHDAGIAVVPLVGPVSLLMTLAASGLNGQNFAFVGYLPLDAAQRVQRIKELEQLALRHNQAQLFIETPYRNPALWQALLAAVQPNTRLVMASGLTLESARIQSRSAKDWKKLGVEPDNRTPVVFALGQ
ncbi:SAM-dependent methyltransferase [Comamonas jiangduensis]|uniref:SAM-dependent methyltransferase n=1 Tax=Comamonas jiangduensis TaxID=1194168 RepID=UPI0028AE3F47|nr:SAM-dependent methyltransferase [Comamonas jiangduensis]